MSNQTPFITIGVASYNYARFLPRAFEAIQRQNFRDFEVLYCDDGSTDDSVAVIRSFMENNPDMHIRLVEGRNGGVMANKNRILENALGEYVMLCDADDWMDDNCLELLAETAKQSGADRVIAGFRNVIDKGDGTLVTGQVEEVPPHPSKWNQFQHHGCLYRRAVYEQHNVWFRPDHYLDDFDFIERFNACCGPAAFVHQVVYNFYHNGQSTSSAVDRHSRWYYLNLFKEITDLAGTLLPQLEPEDAWQLQAVVMRIYLADVFATRSSEELRQLTAMLNRNVPGAAKNPLLYSRNRSPYRTGTFYKSLVLVVLIRLHCLAPAAALYRVLKRGENQ